MGGEVDGKIEECGDEHFVYDIEKVT